MFKTTKLKLLNDEPEPRLGPGISRPLPTQRTREYTVTVLPPKGMPMRVVLQAPSQRDALMYARNRWPAAAVEAVP